MKFESTRTAVFAALSLIIFFANESSADGRRDGEIEAFAKVDRDADLDRHTKVGPFTVVKKAHLHRYAIVGPHCRIGQGVEMLRKAQVMAHSEIGDDAIIGIEAVCDAHTLVGRNATIGDGAVLKPHAEVMSYVKVGRKSILGMHTVLGRRAELEKYACVATHARVGSGTKMGPYSVVQEFVDVPGGLRVRTKQIVISAPESMILIRLLRGRKFSTRFQAAANKLVAQADTGFVSTFSGELDYILNQFSKDCNNARRFRPQMLYLFYAYLQRMHGKEKLTKFVKPLTNIKLKGVQIGKIGKIGKVNGLEELSDCGDPRRYDKVFDKKTVNRFLVLMAIFFDSERDIRIAGGSFCSILTDLLASERSVLAINEKCGGTTIVECNGCGSRNGVLKSSLLSDADVGY